MDQLTKDTFPSQPTQTTVKTKRTKRKRILCNECNKKKFDVNHQVCHNCYKAKSLYKPSGNKVIDDFIKCTLINVNKLTGKMEFVSYDRFKNVEFIAEGGFSKIYKATWIDSPLTKWNEGKRNDGVKVALKEINNSKNINSKELNDVQYPVQIFDYKF